jgi:3-carboxy-cis,cis-muconate cycloisomerase
MRAQICSRSGPWRTSEEPQGTLAAPGDAGPEVVRAASTPPRSPSRRCPRRTSRAPGGRLAAALELAAGTLGKAGTDLALLAAFGEAAEPDGGGCSTMPQERNPSARR